MTETSAKRLGCAKRIVGRLHRTFVLVYIVSPLSLVPDLICANGLHKLKRPYVTQAYNTTQWIASTLGFPLPASGVHTVNESVPSS